MNENNVCNQCGVEEEISIDPITEEEISNLIRVCIDKNEGDYEYFCNKCMGIERKI